MYRLDMLAWLLVGGPSSLLAIGRGLNSSSRKPFTASFFQSEQSKRGGRSGSALYEQPSGVTACPWCHAPLEMMAQRRESQTLRIAGYSEDQPVHVQKNGIGPRAVALAYSFPAFITAAPTYFPCSKAVF